MTEEQVVQVLEPVISVIRSDGRKLPQKDVERRLEVKAMAEQGLSVPAISERLHLGRKQVQKILRRQGIVIWKESPRPSKNAPTVAPEPLPEIPTVLRSDGRRMPVAVIARRLKMREMALAGFSSFQISQRLGLDLETVRDWLKQANIENQADKVLRNKHHRKIDHNHLVSQIVEDAEGIVGHLALVDIRALDVASIKELSSRFTGAVRALRSFSLQLKAARPL